jgi:hypothetical protein
MFPILLLMYERLAVTEGGQMSTQFGDEFKLYVQRTPKFFAHLKQDLNPP